MHSLDVMSADVFIIIYIITIIYQYKVISDQLNAKCQECLNLSNELSDLRRKYSEAAEKLLSLEEGLKGVMANPNIDDDSKEDVNRRLSQFSTQFRINVEQEAQNCVTRERVDYIKQELNERLSRQISLKSRESVYHDFKSVPGQSLSRASTVDSLNGENNGSKPDFQRLSTPQAYVPQSQIEEYNISFFKLFYI